MIIGVPKEIKNHEYRVGLTPSSVRELTARGHSVIVEKNAGSAIGLQDEDYRVAGATMIDRPQEIYANAGMIVKVKEPQLSECALLRPGQVLFTYLHLAPDPDQTDALLDSGAVCIAYETITATGGGLPLLAPMSEIAGRMAIQAGAVHLEKSKGGSGVLLGGVPGVSAGHIVILGAGVVGTCALQRAVGIGARVTVIDRNIERLRQLDLIYGNKISTLFSTTASIEASVANADLLIGGVLLPGASAPKLVSRETIRSMKPGSVVVDVAIDQGGCFETSRVTTHAEPTYQTDGVIHYCVANMPGAVARTSTFALNNATLSYVIALAEMGWCDATKADVHLRRGINVCQGKLTYEAVANAQGRHYTPVETILDRPLLCSP